jgi:hypothetical protein
MLSPTTPYPGVRCGRIASAGELDDLTLDRPALIDRFSGKQLAGNTQVVRRVPLDACAAEVDEAGHDAERGPALIK